MFSGELLYNDTKGSAAWGAISIVIAIIVIGLIGGKSVDTIGHIGGAIGGTIFGCCKINNKKIKILSVFLMFALIMFLTINVYTHWFTVADIHF